MKVELISTTNIPGIDPETSLVYMARISSGKSDEDKYKDPEKLIKYLIKHKHWSPFEMIHATFYIETSIAVSRQLLRHRSFSFQEFSFRYNNKPITGDDFENIELRVKTTNNRQSSEEVISYYDNNALSDTLVTIDTCLKTYNDLLKLGVASETARGILPLCTKTSLYMCGSLRSWIHYLEIRCEESTQKEHRDVAKAIKEIMIAQFPITMNCINNNK